MSWVEASAPSNIALIKYMGKSDVGSNKPTNASLSWTLENLRTFVRIQIDHEFKQDQWNPFCREDLRPLKLSEKGLEKYLAHFDFLKKEFKISGFFKIESANNFPSDCGLASSASSFAALTQVCHQYYLQQSEGKARPYTLKELSRLSQKGSGSSCRSFFSPWALWHDSGAEEIKLPIQNLRHLVILCDETVKTVSSSQAHVQVLTSEMFKGRPERASERLQSLVAALRSSDWKLACQISWNEFWDMHLLFHTSKPSFMYLNGDSMFVLSALHKISESGKDVPLVTMDAGSNVHLLFKENQTDLYEKIKSQFADYYNIWSDEGLILKK